MKTGTLKEIRDSQKKTIITTSTPDKIETPILDVVETPTKNDAKEVVVVEVPKKPTPENGTDDKKEKCTVCAVNFYMEVAARGTFVLLTLALAYFLVKTANKTKS